MKDNVRVALALGREVGERSQKHRLWHIGDFINFLALTQGTSNLYDGLFAHSIDD